MSNDGWLTPASYKQFGAFVRVVLFEGERIEVCVNVGDLDVSARLFLDEATLQHVPATKQNAETIGLALAALIDTIEGLKR